MSPDILQIAHNLARRIPPPAPKPIKPQASWRQLKPGQFLHNVVQFTHEGRVAPPNTLWYVREVSSEGAQLVTVVPHDPIDFLWAMPDWKDKYFTRARKPRKASEEWEWVPR